jgi:hypothetical protein
MEQQVRTLYTHVPLQLILAHLIEHQGNPPL